MPPASYNMPPSTVTPSVPPLSPIAPASDYPLSFAHHPLHALHSLFGGVGPAYVSAVLIICVGVLAAWAWRTPSARPSAFVAQESSRQASPANQAAEPESATPALGKLPVPADRPAGDAGTAAAPGPHRALAGDGSWAPAETHINSAVGGSGVLPLPIWGEATAREVALFSIPAVESGAEYDFEVHNPPVYGTRVLRAKIKFWSDDGGSRESVLAEKIGAVPVVRLMAERSLATMSRRMRFARRGQPTHELNRGGAHAPQAARPADRGGLSFPQYVATMATSAEEGSTIRRNRNQVPRATTCRRWPAA